MRRGGCQCGRVRYTCAAEPLGVWVCHCTNCRAQSASAFGISFVVPSSSLRLTEGEPRFYEWDGDSGSRLRGAFCPSCGSRLWHQTLLEDSVSIKAGSLDGPVDVSDATHIWISSKLPGVAIPTECKQFPEEPD